MLRNSADRVSLNCCVGASPFLVGDIPADVDPKVPYCDLRVAVSLPSTSRDERDVPSCPVCFAFSFFMSSSFSGVVVGGL